MSQSCGVGHPQPVSGHGRIRRTACILDALAEEPPGNYVHVDEMAAFSSTGRGLSSQVVDAEGESGS